MDQLMADWTWRLGRGSPFVKRSYRLIHAADWSSRIDRGGMRGVLLRERANCAGSRLAGLLFAQPRARVARSKVRAV